MKSSIGRRSIARQPLLLRHQLFLIEQKVHHPTAANMRTGRPAMVDYVGRAAGILKGIRQDGKLVEGPPFVNALGQFDDRRCQPRRFQFDRPEAIPEDASQQCCLVRTLGIPPRTGRASVMSGEPFCASLAIAFSSSTAASILAAIVAVKSADPCAASMAPKEPMNRALPTRSQAQSRNCPRITAPSANRSTTSSTRLSFLVNNVGERVGERLRRTSEASGRSRTTEGSPASPADRAGQPLGFRHGRSAFSCVGLRVSEEQVEYPATRDMFAGLRATTISLAAKR